MLKLYTRESSGNSYKARLMLAFLGLSYERVEIEREGGKNQVDAVYLNLNPRAQIPTLDDEGFILWGSTAILYYLALTHDPGRRWLPADPREGAQVMQWMELAQNEILTGLALARGVRRWGFKLDLADCQAKGYKALGVMEKRLRDHQWLATDHPTTAECACFPYVALAPEGDIDMAPYPGVRRWIAQFKTLDRFVSMPGID